MIVIEQSNHLFIALAEELDGWVLVDLDVIHTVVRQVDL